VGIKELTAVEIVEADLNCPVHQAAILALVDAYCSDPMGGGAPLPEANRERLIPGLCGMPTAHVFLAYHGDRAIGIAVCFRGFSTFAARQLLNIHDLAVLPESRGMGVGRSLLAAVEQKARDLNCCKLTLEVQERNHRARGLYQSFGFAQAEYQSEAGGALFFHKRLT